MPATKILWGQIIVVLLIVLATNWGATQWTAWQLGYQPEFGHSWFVLVGIPIYLPPALFWWWPVSRPFCRTRSVPSRRHCGR